MQNSGGRLWFLAGLDTSEFMKAAEALKKELNNIAYVAESQSKRMRDAMVVAGIGSGKFSESLNAASGDVKNLAKNVVQSGNSMESIFWGLAKAAAGFAGVFSAQSIVSSIVRVRGEFQQLEKSFLTMTGSAEETEMIMSQLADTAARTPFGLTELSQAATRLMAYGLETEKVNETLIRLGDIAAGLRIPINDLAYLYGTTMVQGRLYTEDFNQFVGRGIPIIGELAKQFGVAESAVKGLVEEGKVGFPEIEKAIISLTSEGGRFGGLMESQSQTITGQISNLQDSLDMMFNELGQQSEGLISGAISTVATLVENYENVGRLLAELVATYGAYKAALMTITALQKIHSAVLTQAAVSMNLAAAAGHNLTKAQAVATARTKLFQAAMASLNKTLMVNPYVAAAAGVAALGLAIYKVASAQSEAEKAQKRLDDAIESSEKASLSELRALAQLKGELEGAKKDTAEYNAAKNEIIKNYGKYYDGLDAEIEKIGLTADTYDRLTEAIQRSFGARQYEKFASEQSSILDETMSENLKNIQERLIDKLGNEAGARYYAKIRDSIFQGKLSIGDNFYDIKGLDSDTAEVLDRVAGDDGRMFEIIDRSVELYISKIIRAQNLTEELDRLARERFGIDTQTEEPQGSGKGANSLLPKDFDTQVAEAKTAVEKAKKTLADLMAGIIPEDAGKDFDFASAIQAAEKELKADQERYNTLTGYDPKSASDRKKAAEAAAKELADVNERIAKEEYELKRKNTDDKLELIRMEKAQAMKTLQDELDAAKAVYEKLGLPTDELEAQYQKLIDLTAKSFDADTAKEIQSQFDAVLKEVETYEQARLRIQEEYAEKRKALMNEDGTLKEGVTQGNLDELARREQEAIDAISVTFAMRDEAFEQWSASLAEKTADALELMLAEAEEALSILNDTEGVNPDDMASAIAAVKQLSEALKVARKEQAKSDGETEKSEVTWADLNDVLKDSLDIFNDFGSKLPGVAGKLASSLGKVGVSMVTMANAIKEIKDAKDDIKELQETIDYENSQPVVDTEKVESLTSQLKAKMTEAALLGVTMAAGVVEVVSTVVSAVQEIWESNREANEAATQAAWEYAEALEQIQINSRLDKYDTIFGKDLQGEMLENVEIEKDMRKSIDDLFSGAKKRTSTISSIGRTSAQANELANALSGMSSKYNVAITSDMRSGWQKFWGSGKDNIHTFNLGDYIRDDGTVMVEELQAKYEAVADGMSEADKKLVESLIQDGQLLNEAMESIAEYVSSLFGDVSGNIADAMLSAFEETGDAANATFDDIRNNIAKNFAKNAIVSLFSGIFDEEAQSKMLEMIKNGDNEGALRYLDQLIAEAEKLAPVVNETIQAYNEAGNTDLNKSDPERTSASKGIAQASQDSVDELNGRATAIQSHTFSISQDMKTLVSTSAMMLDRLVGIESNTAHLEMIDDNIAIMSREIGNLRSDLTMRGVKLAR